MSSTERRKSMPARLLAGMFLFFMLQFGFAHLLTGCGVPESSEQSESSQRQGSSNQQGTLRQVEPYTQDLRIRTSSGEHILSIELAVDQQQQTRGLMFRRSMAQNHGMLFIYHEERPVGMWMKNTLISLDMLFVKRDGRIVKIETSTEPFSERVIDSGEPVYGVLELNAGTADRLAIKVGDRLQHPLLKSR